MDQQTLIALLTWALMTVGGALIGSIVWFALRSVRQMENLQIALHDLEVRLTRIEGILDGYERRKHTGEILP